jgi:hypothetical protein
MPRRPALDPEPMAQTTIRLPRSLLKQARLRAVTDDITLQALVVEAIASELSRRETTGTRRRSPSRRPGREG